MMFSSFFTLRIKGYTRRFGMIGGKRNLAAGSEGAALPETAERLSIWYGNSHIKAHFDGEHIVLDEPFDIPPNSELAVTVLTHRVDTESSAWATNGLQSLARAYGTDEPE